MYNWYIKFTKNAQIAPGADKAEADIAMQLRQEKIAILKNILKEFIADLSMEIKDKTIQELTNLNTQPTMAAQKALQKIDAQIDPNRTCELASNNLLLEVSSEVAKEVLSKSTPGHVQTNIGTSLNVEQSPILQHIQRIWEPYYKVPDEEIEQMKQKQGIL